MTIRLIRRRSQDRYNELSSEFPAHWGRIWKLNS